MDEFKLLFIDRLRSQGMASSLIPAYLNALIGYTLSLLQNGILSFAIQRSLSQPVTVFNRPL
jgi:hypothetical protein